MMSTFSHMISIIAQNIWEKVQLKQLIMCEVIAIKVKNGKQPTWKSYFFLVKLILTHTAIMKVMCTATCNISEQWWQTSNKAEHFWKIKRNYQYIILSSDIWMKLKDVWCALNVLIMLCLWCHFAHLLFCILSGTTHFCLTVECLVALFHSANT